MTDLLRVVGDPVAESLTDDQAIAQARAEWRAAKREHLILQRETCELATRMFDVDLQVNHVKLRGYRAMASELVVSARRVEAALNACMRAIEASRPGRVR